MPYTKQFDKLVRDRMPEIIEGDGNKPDVVRLGPEQRLHVLIRKLREEVDEFDREPCIEELADILEVVFALSLDIGGNAALSAARAKKFEERGGFSGGVFLRSVEYKD